MVKPDKTAAKAVKKVAARDLKGKGKAASKPVQPASQAVVNATDANADDSDWSSEDEDEDNGGVSEKGMQRLMSLVAEEDLDEMDRATLGLESDDDEDEEEESGDSDGEEANAELVDNEDDDGDDEDDNDNEDDEMLDEESNEDEEEDEDEEDDEEASDGDEQEPAQTKLDHSVLVDEADPDAIAMDDIGSDASLDEDAVPMRKITINNKPALRELTNAMRVTSLPWPEHLVLTSKEIVDVDPSDDLQRETAFYKIALEQVAIAKKLANKHDIPFSRPSDYYAEMVKSDEHMERVRTKLVEESQGIKKSEAAKKQRDLKKYGKQIQHEKIKQREMEKKSFTERMQGVKRKRKEGAELGDDDEFGIQLDEEMDDRPARGESSGRSGRGGRGGGRGGRGGKDQPRMPRHARDAKYSLGGSSRRSKQNTKESTADFGGGSGGGGFRGGGRGGRGGRGGSRGGAGGSRRTGRPGKSRRAAGRT